MPQATLTVTLPGGLWIGDLSRAHPEMRFRVLAALADGDVGVGLAEVTGPSIRPLLAEMRSAPAVSDLTVLQADDREALIQFETDTPFLLEPVRRSGVTLELPFTIEGGEAEWSITAPGERLSDLGETLGELGIGFRVDRVRQHVSADRPLTERQRELVTAAVERGYYDTPRRCTLTELAAGLGLAKSTASETLHRAEERIVKRFVEGRDPTDATG